jgi:hypothetical protein
VGKSAGSKPLLFQMIADGLRSQVTVGGKIRKEADTMAHVHGDINV